MMLRGRLRASRARKMKSREREGKAARKSRKTRAGFQCLVAEARAMVSMSSRLWRKLRPGMKPRWWRVVPRGGEKAEPVREDRGENLGVSVGT